MAAVIFHKRPTIGSYSFILSVFLCCSYGFAWHFVCHFTWMMVITFKTVLKPYRSQVKQIGTANRPNESFFLDAGDSSTMALATNMTFREYMDASFIHSSFLARHVNNLVHLSWTYCNCFSLLHVGLANFNVSLPYRYQSFSLLMLFFLAISYSSSSSILILNFFIQSLGVFRMRWSSHQCVSWNIVSWSVIVCRCASSSYALNWAISTCVFTFDSQHDTWATYAKKSNGQKRLHCLTCTTSWQTLINVKHNRKTTSTTTTTRMMIKMQIPVEQGDFSQIRHTHTHTRARALSNISMCIEQ